ncbi:hypothetical protein D9M71_473220 [compost metagenome]
MGRAHGHVDQLQHRRVQAVGLGGQGRMAAVDGQRVLGQVVGADAEEVHLARQHRGEQRGGRHLDHDADLQVAIDAQFVLQAQGHVARLPPLFELADHREHDPQRPPIGGGKQRAQLGLHDLRALQGQAHAAHAEEGVFLRRDRPVRQRLVAADVEGAHHQRAAAEGIQHMAVGRFLGRVVRRLGGFHEDEFAAQQADALGAQLHSLRSAGGVAEIGDDLHGMPVAGLRRLVAARFGQFAAAPGFLALAQGLGQHVVGRRHAEQAPIAIQQ